MQKQCTSFIKKLEKDQEIALTCTNVPLGILHDFLMEMKGWCVERMIQAQKEESELAEAQKQNDCLGDNCDGG